MLRRTRAQVLSSFGSKTTHWVPRRTDCSTKMNSRRTLMYFHCASLDRVRAPQIRMPSPLVRKSRIALTPLGFKIS